MTLANVFCLKWCLVMLLLCFNLLYFHPLNRTLQNYFGSTSLLLFQTQRYMKRGMFSCAAVQLCPAILTMSSVRNCWNWNTSGRAESNREYRIRAAEVSREVSVAAGRTKGNRKEGKEGCKKFRSKCITNMNATSFCGTRITIYFGPKRNMLFPSRVRAFWAFVALSNGR